MDSLGEIAWSPLVSSREGGNHIFRAPEIAVRVLVLPFGRLSYYEYSVLLFRVPLASGNIIVEQFLNDCNEISLGGRPRLIGSQDGRHVGIDVGYLTEVSVISLEFSNVKREVLFGLKIFGRVRFISCRRWTSACLRVNLTCARVKFNKGQIVLMSDIMAVRSSHVVLYKLRTSSVSPLVPM